eukprot:705014-Hanusia_phi.AAC.1
MSMRACVLYTLPLGSAMGLDDSFSTRRRRRPILWVRVERKEGKEGKEGTRGCDVSENAEIEEHEEQRH